MAVTTIGASGSLAPHPCDTRLFPEDRRPELLLNCAGTMQWRAGKQYCTVSLCGQQTKARSLNNNQVHKIMRKELSVSRRHAKVEKYIYP